MVISVQVVSLKCIKTFLVLLVVFLSFAYAPALAQEEPEIQERPKLYVEAQPFPYEKPKPLQPKPAPKNTYCSCVKYVKSLVGVQESWGWAGRIKPTSHNPEIGKVVITKEGGGHVGLVLEVTETKIKITEANYKKCKKGERWININNPLIKGYKDIIPKT